MGGLFFKNAKLEIALGAIAVAATGGGAAVWFGATYAAAIGTGLGAGASVASVHDIMIKKGEKEDKEGKLLKRTEEKDRMEKGLYNGASALMFLGASRIIPEGKPKEAKDKTSTAFEYFKKGTSRLCVGASLPFAYRSIKLLSK